MFNFFSKKYFLIDQLNGFIDIHNHILPGIDDGSKNTIESIAIINGFSQFGVTNFICTPHIMQGYHDNTPAKIKASYESLKSAIEKEKMSDITINYAAEHMIDVYFEDKLEENEVMPLSKYYLLVEMSFLQASINFNQAIEKIISKDYFPILAHPERYVFHHSKFGKYHDYKQKNILFQVNLLSLAGYYGGDVKNIAIKLIDEGLVNFLASDVHNIEQLKHIKECRISQKMIAKLDPLINNTIATFW